VQNGGRVSAAKTLRTWWRGTLNLKAGGLVTANLLDITGGSTFNLESGGILRVNRYSIKGDDLSMASHLQLGHMAGSSKSGTHTLGDGVTLGVGGDFVVGYDAPGQFINGNGVNTVGGELVLADQAGSTGLYVYQGGTLNVTGGIRGGAGTSEFAVGGGAENAILAWNATGLSATNLDQFTIRNNGTVELLDGATLSSDRLDVNSGGLLTLGVENGAVSLPMTLNNTGEIRISTGCTVTYWGNVSGPGSFTGLGTHYFEGDMSPGSSPGDVSIEGSAVFGSGAELCIELSGLASGSEYDTLSIEQLADLGGTLDVCYLGPFAAAPGNQFVILSAASIADEFDTVNFPDAQDWFINYDTPNGNVVVGVVPEPATMSLLALGGLAIIRRRRRS